nr:hypothetical protein Itr_chr01CG09100 [Ipomoea trifida]
MRRAGDLQSIWRPRAAGAFAFRDPESSEVPTINKGKGKAYRSQSRRRSFRRIKEKEATELRRLLRSTRSEPFLGDSSEYPLELSLEEENQ